MSTITKLSHHECSICHKCYTNKKLVAKCEVQCLEKYDIEHEDSMENDLTIMDVTENVIDNTPPQLAYDFSAPVPVSGYADAKNLKLMKIIKEFDISQKAHISLAKDFNEILSKSSEISYRVLTPYLGTKLLSRFLGVDEETYHICCNRCMLYNNNQQTECPHCDKAYYNTGKRSQDTSENPIPASTMIQLPLGRQLALALMKCMTFVTALANRSGGSCVASMEKIILSFSLAAQKEIGTAMVSPRRSILTSFHGAWINIATRSGYFRAVDWADFILFVIPTLVAERVRDQAAHKALLDLVQICNLLMS
ncbi:hypothetical protein PHYBLDRAFT_173902 [Phycomyces blakesleeanus NRRL 1555(-)]|uniref:Uncharacterized protein n=1 Tax=Phycomyces blakesleeanus (strain ATCC 8743b / DSM 1359 / FGSC 10004 / NBRC 33097 / NRRL 1555) TaxID=763407 RepID=A0A162ZN49_PHYB8|nr:hypothetical protein PHYBLDRAFT_173902 [Phycomyces blakesleeanus NRRL 1555(-)]OAD67991.1 hypothetical protein PHYBLDRAFT_173902 [Phycomyces blakesleeanus NRRL 1555(-)]|eukprot:XP_018286031.1 hypothetical protein PHYBLDRAFT_173902 [Phycomyces blakesleeanus NRRL 1555(-)]